MFFYYLYLFLFCNQSLSNFMIYLKSGWISWQPSVIWLFAPSEIWRQLLADDGLQEDKYDAYFGGDGVCMPIWWWWWWCRFQRWWCLYASNQRLPDPVLVTHSALLSHFCMYNCHTAPSQYILYTFTLPHCQHTTQCDTLHIQHFTLPTY